MVDTSNQPPYGFDFFETITGVSFPSLKGWLAMGAQVAVAIGVVLDAASINITVNGHPWASGSLVVPAGTFAVGNFQSQAQIVDLFAGGPVPDVLVFSATASWHVVGGGGPFLATMDISATWYKDAFQTDPYEPTYVQELGSANAGGATLTMHSRRSTHHNFT